MTDQETLDATIARKAEEWTDEDLNAIVAGFEALAAKWNAEQMKGSRKLVRSSTIQTSKAPGKKGKFAELAKNLQGVKL